MDNNRIVDRIVSANSGHDVVAILRDGSIHSCTDHYSVGIGVRVGLNWDTLNARYEQLVARAREERERRRKIV